MAEGTELGKAWVQIVPSARGISGSISNVLKGEANSAGTSTGLGIAGKVKSALAAAGIGAALWKSLSEGGKLEQSFIGGLDTIYGSAADKAREYAAAAVQAGISQNDFAEQAVSFGAALKAAYSGDTQKAMEAANTAILDMTDNAAKMGTPIESIQMAYQGFAKQNYTMLDNLKLGYGGTKSEMQRLLADAEKISGVKYDISNLGDVYDAIHVIQGDLGLTGVAAAEASETFSGSMNAMKAAAQNLAGNLMLGENVAPAMQTLVQTASTFLFNNLIPAVGRIIASLPTAISAFIQTAIPQIAAAGSGLMDGIINGIQTKIPELATRVPEAVQQALNALPTLLPQVAARGAEILQKLGSAIVTAAPQLASAAKSIITSLVEFIGNNLPQIASSAGNLIGRLVTGLIANLPKIAAAAARIIAFLVSNLAKVAATLVRSGANLVAGIASGIGGAIASKVGAVMARLKSAITQPIQSAKDTISGIISRIKGLFPLSIGRIFSNLKVPHINVSGGKAPFGIGGLGTAPSISVTWAARGLLLNRANLIGLGAGENGLEGVVPLSGSAMRPFARAIAGEIPGGARETHNTYNITVNEADDAHETAREVVNEIEILMRTA